MIKELRYFNNLIGRININQGNLCLLIDDKEQMRSGVEGSYLNKLYKLGNFKTPIFESRLSAIDIYINSANNIFTKKWSNSSLQKNGEGIFEDFKALEFNGYNAIIFKKDMTNSLKFNLKLFNLEKEKFEYEVEGYCQDIFKYKENVLLYNLNRKKDSNYQTKEIVIEKHSGIRKKLIFGYEAEWKSIINYNYCLDKNIEFKDPIKFHGIYNDHLYMSFESGDLGKLNLANGIFTLLSIDWRDSWLENPNLQFEQYFWLKEGKADLNKGVIYSNVSSKGIITMYDLNTDDMRFVNLKSIFLEYGMKHNRLAAINEDYLIIIDYIKNGGLLVLNRNNLSDVFYLPCNVSGERRVPLEAEIKGNYLFVYDRSKSLAVYELLPNKE